MTDPRGDTPCERKGVPVGRGIPDCSTGPIGRLRFVARELAALWPRRRTTSEE
jgi:hypothetical protein